MVDSTVIVGILSLVGTLVGAFGGIMAANRLTTYRIGQLEKKVDKHNSMVERVTAIEIDMDNMKDDIKCAKDDIKNLTAKLI